MAKRNDSLPAGPVSLKTLAAYLNLDPTTVSVVLNQVPGRSIPEATRERIRKAALKFNYQPSFLARSLRNRRTMTIGILVPVLADGYHAEVMTGIGDSLLDKIAAMAVVGDEVEILFLEQAVPDARHHFRMIAVRKDRN